MLKLKAVRSPVSWATVSVSVAGVDCPGFRVLSCGFHVSVRHPLASVGAQLLVAIVSVIGVVPVFFTYIVRLVELPGYNVPQLIVVQFWSQFSFEYTPTFTVVIVPFDAMFCVAIMPAVTSDRNKPVISPVESFGELILLPFMSEFSCLKC
jgi:hypothetical protein